MKRGYLWLGIAVAVVGGVWLGLKHRHSPQLEALHIREIATRGLAQYLVRTSPGARALIISNPFTLLSTLPKPMRETEEAGLRGLKLALETKVKLAAVAFPEVKPESRDNPRAVFIDPESTTPLSYLVTEDAFDKLARQHADCDLIISLIGLPANLSRVECWQKPEGPKFALLLPDLRVIGNRAAVRQALAGGKLVAFVAARPGLPENLPAARDVTAEFEQRFVLVTRENIDRMMRDYPQLFPAN